MKLKALLYFAISLIVFSNAHENVLGENSKFDELENYMLS